MRLLAEVAAARDGEHAARLSGARRPTARRSSRCTRARTTRDDRWPPRFWPDAPAPPRARTCAPRSGPCARPSARTRVTSRTAVGLRPGPSRSTLGRRPSRAAAGDAEPRPRCAAATCCPATTDDWAEPARARHRAELARPARRRSPPPPTTPATAAARGRWSRLRCELAPLDEPAHGDADPTARRGRRPGRRAGRRTRARRPAARGAGRRARRRRARRGCSPGPRGPTAAARPRVLGTRAPAVRAGRRAAHADRRPGPRRAPGTGGWSLITGEAGIGKTRLVAELARRAENAGARVAVGAGVDVGGEAPLAVWQELAPRAGPRSSPAPPDDARAGRPSWAGWRRTSPRALGRAEPPPPVVRRRSWSGCGSSTRCCGWSSGPRRAGRCCWWPRTCTGPTGPAWRCARTSAGGWPPCRCCSC